MEYQDTRWEQRLKHFQKALALLQKGVELSRPRPLSYIEQLGLIKSFELSHELAWNLMKDYFALQGDTSIMGARDATREAFQQGLISADEEWMDMLNSRDRTPYTYDEEVADQISRKIIETYVPLLQDLSSKIQAMTG